jgi:succinyl-diaminopimelate desuccinylase
MASDYGTLYTGFKQKNAKAPEKPQESLMTPDPIELTQKLVAMNTVNPPGNERACLELLAEILKRAGADTILHPMGETRGNLVARIEGGGSQAKPLCFTGHVDTVPIGLAPWSFDPFCGTVRDGKLLGRGSTDMKGGVAAFVSAACDYAASKERGQPIEMIITSAEETGCEGAIALAKQQTLKEARALVVAEPTSNALANGHKGVLWLKAVFSGRTAHGSMPHLGDNAAYKAAEGLLALRDFKFDAPSHRLGAPTLNAGFVHAGININSVPDRAEIGVDVRTTPAVNHADIRKALEALLPQAQLETILDLLAVWTEENDAWLGQARDIAETISGHASKEALAVSYFTDASALAAAIGHPPIVVIGPGEAAMAHRTDEYCEVSRIVEATTIYRALMQAA